MVIKIPCEPQILQFALQVESGHGLADLYSYKDMPDGRHSAGL